MTKSKAVIALEKEILDGAGPVLDALRARLSNSCKKTALDSCGNTIYIDGEIFSEQELLSFMDGAAMRASTLGYRISSDGLLEYPLSKEQVNAFIYQGALVSALAAKALQERGREFTISDGGVSFKPPPVSKLLHQQYELELATLNQMYSDQRQ